MKNKTNIKIIIAFLLGLIISGSIGVYATIRMQADEIGYKDGTVEEALDYLYVKKSQGVQVATLTTQGATYTMQNDGYIVGTAQSTGVYAAGTGSSAIIFLNDKRLVLTTYSDSSIYDVSIYVEKGTVVTTRSDAGTYNLTVYEWK